MNETVRKPLSLDDIGVIQKNTNKHKHYQNIKKNNSDKRGQY